MRVLIIAFNQLAIPLRVAPVGALYLAAAIRRHGHEVKLVDLMFSKHPLRDVREAVLAFQPDVVGGSIRNVDTVVGKERSFLGYYRTCLDEVRRHTKAPVILGGPGFSNFPREIMLGLRPDFGMVGEADRSFPQLLVALASTSDMTDIKGLVRWEGDELHFAPVDITQDLDDIPHQAIDLLNAEPYRTKRGYFGVLTRRSCTGRCLFCNERQLHGQKVRLRAPQLVVEELRYLIKSTGMRYYGFADPIFNSPRQHMIDILASIVHQALKINFQLEINPLGLDDESVRLIKRAGCSGVDFTADAGAATMFQSLCKGYNGADVLRGAELLHRHGLPYSVGFLLGAPGENLQTITETLQLAKALPKPHIVYFSVGMVILQGAALAEIAGARHEIKQSDDLIQIRYVLDPGFDERCAQLLLDACERHTNFFVTESFYAPALAPMWAIADLLNLRSSWQHPGVAKILMRLSSGSGVPYWDERRRRFANQRPA